MPLQPDTDPFRFETEWIRSYATTYSPGESAFGFCPDDLRRVGATLVQIRHACRSGNVVSDIKCDGPGAIWIVDGQDQDESWLRLKLWVVSEEHRVVLLDLERARRQESENGAA